jgi:hypothetical protein
LRHIEPYNPLELGAIKDGIVRTLLKRDPEPLPPGEAFVGVGVYSLYYVGGFPGDAALAGRNRDSVEAPIYVGKADTGAQGVYRRLCEHAESIGSAENLDCADFLCRFLVMDRVWITLAEDALVAHYQPVWNSVVKGFGIHTPGRGRGQQKRSMWDTLHPGRGFVDGLGLPQGRWTAEDLEHMVREHLG